MLRLLQVWLRKIASDTHSAIVNAICLALFGGAGFSLWHFQHPIGRFLKRDIPLWLSLASSFTLLLIATLIVWFRERRSVKPASSSRQELMRIGQFKWMVLHRNGYVQNVGGLPYCDEHETSFVPSGNGYSCPVDTCKSAISRYDLDKAQVVAKSIIDKMVRDMKRR